MLRIRLSRTGKKKQPSYRVVVANIEAKRDGRVVERIGHVNPLVEPTQFSIEEDRALYWLSVGAQPTDAVRILLEKQGTYDRLTRLRNGESFDMLVSEFAGVPVVDTEIEDQADQAAVDEMAEAVGVEEEE